ncbi:hypothetical protein FOCG_18384 [Fusarium oxysporum f. sp. radicis-lycopersici 26381]|nr:hypothetical protein FOCG_18384 [Fusarium oxysporum f. sp. radicis-lycopersici 26381]
MKALDIQYTLLELTLRAFALFVEMVFLALISLGIPIGTWYFTWDIDNEISPLAGSVVQISLLKEARAYLGFLSLFLPWIIWLTLPYCSVNVLFSPKVRLCADFALFLLEVLSTCFSGRLISIVMAWLRCLRTASLWREVVWCQALIGLLSFVLFVSLVGNSVLLSLLLSNQPKIARQIISEGRERAQKFIKKIIEVEESKISAFV